MKIKISRYINILGLSILIIGFVFMSFPSKSLADTLALSFAQQFEGQNERSGSSVSDVVLDQEGNIYTTGVFSGTVDFDPSEGTHELTSSNDSTFISILASDGSFIGAYQFENGETGWSGANSITLDEQGNIYTTGVFQGTVDFDPSEGTHELTSSNSNGSSFISILGNDGSFIGAYKIGDEENGWSYTSSITLDTEGNIYTTGVFFGTVDFGNGEVVSSSNGSNSAGFLVKLDSSGDLLFTRQFISENGYSRMSSMDLDQEGNIYTTGYFYGTVDFDPSESAYNLTSSNTSSFISTLASDGSFIGAYQLENGENSGSEVYSITLDTTGNIYITGRFYGTVDFDPSGKTTYELTSSNTSSFISILASDGSFIGAYQLGNGENGLSESYTIVLGVEGNIYITGRFRGLVDFDPGIETHELSSNNDNDSSFISILSSDGSFIGAYQFENGENGYSQAYSITLDTEGNIYTTGYFGGIVDFDPSVNTYNLTSLYDSGFILKLIPQEDTPTPSHSHIKSSGSSVSTIAKFLQEQYQRALSVGMDATSYLQALNTYLQSHGL